MIVKSLNHKVTEKGRFFEVSKFSGTPVNYRRPPPRAGQHSDEVREDLLNLTEAERADLREKGVI